MEMGSEFNTGGSPVIDQHPICMGWRGEGRGISPSACPEKLFNPRL